MRSAPAFVALLACGLASLAIASPANAQMVRIPGTSVAMAAPPGFKPSRNPPGLANAETGSSIVIAELPQESYAEAVAVFASPKTASTRYASQGIRFIRIEQLTIGAAQVPLAIGGQAENGREIRKYIAVMGGPQSSTKTTLITFSITRSDPLSQSDVEAALRSVVARPRADLGREGRAADVQLSRRSAFSNHGSRGSQRAARDRRQDGPVPARNRPS